MNLSNTGGFGKTGTYTSDSIPITTDRQVWYTNRSVMHATISALQAS